LPRLSQNVLILGVTVGLVLTVTLLVARTEKRESAGGVAQVNVATEPGAGVRKAAAEPELSVADPAAVARTRAISEFASDELAPLDSERRREGRRHEAESLAQFQTLFTEQGLEALERAVQDVLGSRSESQSRKVAGLRALQVAGSPKTVSVLAAAVTGEPDSSDGTGPSVPRVALKLLFGRAPTDEEARRALTRLAFVEETRLSADLRRQASTALAGSIRVPQHDEVERLLRLETSPAQLDAALEALSRDTNFGAAK